MTVEEALEEADFITGGRDVSERTARATMTLAAEVRRLRAGVEAVRALPRYDCLFDGMHVDTDGDFIDRDDVLAALEMQP